ncbi:MAG TPA: hypothetical protein VM600_06535, partial [Actinomycetota bacterium]|nr:hypothetical protein [Actinomycetota bacterium]
MKPPPKKIPVHRSIAAIARASMRAAPWRTLVVLVLGSVSAVADALFAWWTKLLVDAAVAQDLVRAMWVVAGMGGTLTIAISSGVSGFLLRVGLEERVGLYLDDELVSKTAGLPGIEHHERPEYLDQVELLRNDRTQLSQSVGALVENVGIFVRLGGTIVLLGTLHPLLLTLPLFGLPSLWAGARGQAILLAADEQLAELRRRGKALFDLATTPGAAK